MVDWLATGFVIALTLLDVIITRRRIVHWGLGVELNPLLVKLARWLSLDVALALVVFLPSTLWAVTALATSHWRLLWFLVGYRLLATHYQIVSLRIEREMEQYREATKAIPRPKDP